MRFMSATARSATSILGVALGLSVSVSCNADGGTVKKEDANSKATADPEVYEGQLRLVREIVLEEPDSAPLGAIASFGSLHDSLFVVVDQMSSRVRVYGKAGKLLSSFGRAGGGPGEFLQIQAGAFDQLGRVHTVETGSRRLTRFSTTGQLQLVTQMAPGTQIVSGPDSILALVRAAEPGAPAVAVITSSHRVVTQVMPIDTVYSTVPYWNALLRAYIALAPNTLFGATSLVYRIHSYDLQTGTTKQPFGTPPKSWRETPRPERSQFAGASARTALAAWLNELTVLAGLYALND